MPTALLSATVYFSGTLSGEERTGSFEAQQLLERMTSATVPGSKIAALDARHQIFGAWVEVDDFHNCPDGALGVEVGIQSVAKTPALQHGKSISSEFRQCFLMLLVIVEEETQVLHPFPLPLQELFIAGIA